MSSRQKQFPSKVWPPQFSLKLLVLAVTATGILFGSCRQELQESYESTRAMMTRLMKGKEHHPPATPPQAALPSNGLSLMKSPMENISHLRLVHTFEGIESSSAHGEEMMPRSPSDPKFLPFLQHGEHIDIHMGENEVVIDTPSGSNLSDEQIILIIQQFCTGTSVNENDMKTLRKIPTLSGESYRVVHDEGPRIIDY